MRQVLRQWASWLAGPGMQLHDMGTPWGISPGRSIISPYASGHHAKALLRPHEAQHQRITTLHAACRRLASASGRALSRLLELLTRILSLLVWLFGLITRLLEDLQALSASLPRAFRMAGWAVGAGLSYRRLIRKHGEQRHENEKYAEELLELHKQQATLLAGVCKANGGVYVKFGQFAVAFGAIPREYRTILAQLEDKARPRPFDQIRASLLRELGLPLTEGLGSLLGPPGSGAVFVEFEQKAAAAASLAQVHRARLSTGEEVAVKVQYPGLRSAVRADLITLAAVAQLAAALFPQFSLVWLYEELKGKLAIELDFRSEVLNAARLHETLTGPKAGCQAGAFAAVPAMHAALCTRSMVVMEWVQGVKITDQDALRALGVDPRAVGLALVRLFAEMAFVTGYVHADPHPGNLQVRPRGHGRQEARGRGPLSGLRRLINWVVHGSGRRFEIVLLDHGGYLDLEPALREQFCALWCCFAAQDKGTAAAVSERLAGPRAGRVLPVLLTHQAKSAKEEQALQRSVGITGFGDMATILATAPKDLVELLRINTVIRASSNILGVTMNERKRIFAWFARRGLPPRSQRAAHIPDRMNSLSYRLRLLVLLSVWSGWCWTKEAAGRSWHAIFHCFADVIYGDS